MSRNGKIARLPDDIRRELNRRMDNNEEGQPLLEWLNALPQTREILGQRFNGAPISKQNLSEWRRGGYREWVIHQDLHSKAFDLSDVVRQMEQSFDSPLLAGDLATVLAAHYARILSNWDGQANPKIEARLHVLRILCRDIALLQRTMHRAFAQKNELYENLEQEDKQELKEMKTKALAPIMALLQEKHYASLLGNTKGARKLAAFIASIDNDQPDTKFDDKPKTGQTQSKSVKPGQT